MKRYANAIIGIILLVIIFTQACSAAKPLPETAPPDSQIPEPLLTFAPQPPEITEPYINEIKSRYYTDVMLALVAKNDYGKIYPYIGGFIYPSAFSGLNYLYGVVDSKGRIICDPVYNSVSFVESPDGEKIYLFRKYGKSNDENYEVGGVFVFSALDGSWVKRYEQAHFMEYTPDVVAFDYIAVCSDGKWGAIDYNGNDILPCEYKSPPLFREGLAPVLTDDEKSYVYINKSGNVVLGPYKLPPKLEKIFDQDNIILEKMFFSNGRALYFEDGKYGFIDKQGNVVIKPQFTEHYGRYIFEDGFSVVMDENENFGVIDIDGNFIIPMEMTYILSWSSDSFLCDTPNGRFVYDIFGNYSRFDEFYDIGGGWSTIYSPGDELTIRGNGTGRVIKNANNAFFLEEDKFVINHVNPHYQSIENIYGRVYLRSSDEYSDDYANWIVRDGKILAYVAAKSFANPLLSGTYGVLDFNGKSVIPQEYNHLEPIGDNYLVTQGFYGGLLDKNGNWIIKVSLLDYMND